MACKICHKKYMSPSENDEFDPDTKPHVCTTCGQSFSLKIQLKRHTLLHANGESFVCVKCAKDNGNQESKTYNLRLSKKSEGYTCEICNESFNSKRLLLRHTTKEHAFEKFYDCDDCSESFDSAYDLKKHSETHKTKVSHKRRSTKVASNESASSDTLSEKPKSLSCQLCSKSFAYQACLDKHTRNCKSLPSATPSSNEIHKKGKAKLKKPDYDDDSSEDMDKKHVCDICNKSFTRKSALEGHEAIHLNADYDSPEEDENDSDESMYEKKKPKLSEINLKKSYTCNSCNFVCFSKFTLEKHMKNHEDQTRTEKDDKNKTHNCNKCHKSFFSEEDLELHLEVHLKKENDKKLKNDNNAEFNCEICPQVFHSKSKLKKHLLLHMDDDDEETPKTWRSKRNKEFSCDVCGKRFAGETCLARHMKKHEEGAEDSERRKKRKPVETMTCEFCEKEFTGRKGAFIKHVHSHTPEVCGICDERFVDRQGLREHCKIHVGTEEGRMFMECSQKALDAKNGIVPPEPKVEYIYLVIR